LGLDFQSILQRAVTFLPLLLISLTFHEWAHAWSASRLGDDTAERAGRLTLNPLPHIDPIGTILFPLLGMPIGWAKPVPVNVTRFRRDVNMNTGSILVSGAGPVSNLFLALVSSILLGLLARFSPDLFGYSGTIAEMLRLLILMNVMLAIFNLLPLPPLDGGHVAEALMPNRLRPQWEAFARVAPFVLLALVLLPGRPLLWLLEKPSGLVFGVLGQIIAFIA
jgi:Zn-dependent protease